MTTARTLVTRQMQKIGALTKNEQPSSDEANDALEVTNDLIASWSTDSTKIYARTLENFPISANDGEYTIGTGANFNTSRPLKIISAYVRIGTIDTPVEIVSDENFANISVKTTQGTPEYLNYDAAFPTGNIKLHPVPSQAATLFLLTEKEITQIESLNTVLSFPPGWKRALIYNGAVELTPEYGQLETIEFQIIKQIAIESKEAITSAVIKTKSFDVPGNLGASRSIYNPYP